MKQGLAVNVWLTCLRWIDNPPTKSSNNKNGFYLHLFLN